MNDPKCAYCGHSLKDNNHGIDQNDVNLVDNKIKHSGVCTYCKYCNYSPGDPGILLEKE